MSICDCDINHEDHEATYCPEDDKLRLYCGRVERETYMHLRHNGWRSTQKQDCDFAREWTPNAERDALIISGYIGDEDMAPDERAADRAERFDVYRSKRTDEAHGYADRYESGPSAHGFQNAARAERAKQRHDRLGDHATTQWGKAEYWAMRTAGVIHNALYKQRPDVRERRLRKLQAELRKRTKEGSEARKASQLRWDVMTSIVAHANGSVQKMKAVDSSVPYYVSRLYPDLDLQQGIPVEITRMAIAYQVVGSYYSNSDMESMADRLWEHTATGEEIAAEWLEHMPERPHDWTPEDSAWCSHLNNRIAYEEQMRDAAGGTVATVEMMVGGRIGGTSDNPESGLIIHKVNKSPATSEIVSLSFLGKNYSDQPTLKAVKMDGIQADAYHPPCQRSMERLTEEKAKLPGKPSLDPLVNPTNEDAERLQAIWNAASRHPSEVWFMTADEYKNRSQGSISSCETESITDEGHRPASHYGRNVEDTTARVRAGGSGELYGSRRVIVLTDKPQKAIPITWQVDPQRRMRIKICSASTCELERILTDLGIATEEHSRLSHGDMRRLALAQLDEKKEVQLA